MNKGLKVGSKYLIKHYTLEGGELPKELWGEVIWNGRSLIDDDGCTWNEWLDTPDDIVELEKEQG